jgi:hypothetical protein
MVKRAVGGMMPKSKLNAKPQVEKEKEFLLNLPEIHWFIACRVP